MMLILTTGFLMLTATASDEAALPSSAPTVNATQVEVASVTLSAIEQVNVPTSEQGSIIEFDAEEGQEFRKGDTLAKIDPRDAELAMRRSRLELEVAKAHAANTTDIDLARKSLELAKADMTRAQKSRALYAKAISDEELDHRQLLIDQAEIKVRQAQEAQQQRQRDMELAEVTVQMMDVRLKRHQIVAPVDGVLVEVKHRVGEWVEAGQPVARIVRVDRLRAEGFVDAVHLPELKRGQPVQLTVTSANAETSTFAGVLKFVSPEVVAVDGRIRVWAEIDNQKKQLHPGTRARMTVDTGAL
ncbi:MAG: efflux RND transporter periplasmic adaptor subunit [Planctomycetaceae bacterium]